MKNIHLISTDKASRLWLTKLGNLTRCHDIKPIKEALGNNVNIYITSDEEIKQGDWYKSGKFIWQMKYPQWGEEGQGDAKKIILTTDQDLIKDGVQAIDDEFLEWFLKNPSCEWIEVNKLCYGALSGFADAGYKIIILKEEQKKILVDMMQDDEELGLYDDIKANRVELVCKDCSDSLEDCACIVSTIDLPKQEDEFCYYSGLPSPSAYSKEEIKLEEVFNDEKKENIKKFIDEINNPSQPNDKLKQAFEKYSEYLEDFENKNTYEHGFKDGAKCQQEISYSEEEVIQLVSDWTDYRMSEDTKSKITFKKWFEQFKKK